LQTATRRTVDESNHLIRRDYKEFIGLCRGKCTPNRKLGHQLARLAHYCLGSQRNASSRNLENGAVAFFWCFDQQIDFSVAGILNLDIKLNLIAEREPLFCFEIDINIAAPTCIVGSVTKKNNFSIWINAAEHCADCVPFFVG